MEELIKLLSEENATYIFVYLLFYYSIYKDRCEWRYINIENLKALMENGKSLVKEKDRIENLIKKSLINHRYSDAMYMTLVDNMNKEITGEWLETIYRQKNIDAFYITVIKLCVFEHKYCPYYQESGLESKVFFINELTRHTEILRYDSVQAMIVQMQYEDFRCLKYWPDNLHITLRSLLLTDIKISDEMLDNINQYYDYADIGKYLLIKHDEGGGGSEAKRELIKKAYIAGNASVQEYVEELYTESCLCNLPINYAEKEKMKSYLLEVI